MFLLFLQVLQIICFSLVECCMVKVGAFFLVLHKLVEFVHVVLREMFL